MHYVRSLQSDSEPSQEALGALMRENLLCCPNLGYSSWRTIGPGFRANYTTKARFENR